MARRLIPMRLAEYLDRWYVHGPSHNCWIDSRRFVIDIIERPKIIRTLYVLTLSDDSEITVDGSYRVEVEQY